MELTFEEGRVVGSLIEKQLTTPQQYPLTLNALVLACNQSSNREPVVQLDDRTVERTLRSLKDAGLVRFVHPSHGRSVIRYQHAIDQVLPVDAKGLSVLAVLLLRGPQTAAEIRARTERMAELPELSDVTTELEYLATRLEPLVLRRARVPGQKEERWAQLLAGGTASDAVVQTPAPARLNHSQNLVETADLGAATADPGAATADLGAATADPGAATADPGAATADPGAATADPGAATADPGAATADPGAATADPGAATADPGAAADAGAAADPGLAFRLRELEDEVAGLRRDICELQASLEDLRAQLGA